MMTRFKTLIPSSPFLRNVGMLTTGAVAAQGIMALALPVLTRLYAPADFNLLAVYASTLGLLTVASCLRFNVAIPLPTDDRSGADLLILALASGATCALLVAVPIVLAPQATAKLLGQPGIRTYLWMFPFGIFFASAYDALQYWASRKRRFALVMRTRVTRAIAGAGTQLAIGASASGPFGLIFGHMIYSGMGVAGLASSLWRADGAAVVRTSIARLRATGRRYRKFPLYSVPEAVFNMAGPELSMLIIAAVAVRSEAGFLMLAMRVMGLPMTLIGTSIGQVYLSEGPAALQNGDLARFTKHIMRTLFLLGGPPVLVVGLVSPFMFPIVFGAEWARAGIMVAWLTPMFILQLVASPVSMAPHIMGKVGWAMGLQIAGGIFRVGSVVLAAYLWPHLLVETFAVSSAVFYVGAIGLTNIILRMGHSS